MPKGETQEESIHWMNLDTRRKLAGLILKLYPDIPEAYGNPDLSAILSDDQLYDVAINNRIPEKFLGEPQEKTLLYQLRQTYPKIYSMYPNVDFTTFPEGILKRLVQGESPLDLLGNPSSEAYRIQLQALKDQYELDYPHRRGYTPKGNGSPRTVNRVNERDTSFRSHRVYHGDRGDH